MSKGRKRSARARHTGTSLFAMKRQDPSFERCDGNRERWERVKKINGMGCTLMSLRMVPTPSRESRELTWPPTPHEGCLWPLGGVPLREIAVGVS